MQKQYTLEELNNQYGSVETDSSLDNAQSLEMKLESIAKLSELDYFQQRKQFAKELNTPLFVLDKLVKEKWGGNEKNKGDIFSEIEPWDHPVVLSELLAELTFTLNRFLVFPSEHEARIASLWIIHTHCIEAFNISPILHINSPEKRCGKSTLLKVLQRLVKKPISVSNISAAAIYRAIEKWEPTLLIDEADTFMKDNEEIRGVINSGHSRESAYVIRCVGNDHEPTRFNTWCAKIIAGIGSLADTIEDRSINVRLRRKLPHEKREQLHEVPIQLFNDSLRKCVRFAIDNIAILGHKNPTIPSDLNDRAADNWRSLLSIAELAGSDWVTQAHDAAIYLNQLDQSHISPNAELLQDIKNVFESKKVDRLTTIGLLEALCEDNEAPWVTYNRGKPLSARQLANKLKEYDISSKTIRISSFETKKGYLLQDLKDAFNRYIPEPSLPAGVTTSQVNNHVTSNAILRTSQMDVLRIDNVLETPLDKACDVVTDKLISERVSREVITL